MNKENSIHLSQFARKLEMTRKGKRAERFPFLNLLLKKIKICKNKKGN